MEEVEQNYRDAVGPLTAEGHRDWFERLYTAADEGIATVPWDRGSPHHVLSGWAAERGLTGDGKRAVVVGCGLGEDSEFLAGLGFATTAFDFSAAAIQSVHRRFPDSTVDYRVADLLNLPPDWLGAFDLVVESLTVQAIPPQYRTEAIAAVCSLVAKGGTLFVHAGAKDEAEADPEEGPWRLTRAQVESFEADGLTLVSIDMLEEPEVKRWRAVLHG
jgi:SAM-dependent methyltransferase